MVIKLICRRREEVSVHSRICSVHFTDGVKKTSKDLPQIFPRQRYYSASTPTNISRNQVKHQPTPSQIVYHDHCYCSSHYHSIIHESSPEATGSSYLTPITASDMLHQTLPITDVSTLTDPCIQSQSSFSIDPYSMPFRFLQVLRTIKCYWFVGDSVHHFQ